MLCVSKLLSSEINPLIYGALISRIIELKDNDNNNYFAIVSSFKKSKKLEINDFDWICLKYLENIKKITSNNEWINYDEFKQNYPNIKSKFTGNEKAILLIENDLNISCESFFNKLYARLFSNCSWFLDENFNHNKKLFIIGFCELRGSIDLSLNFIAHDYFYNNEFELKKALLLVDYLNVPCNVMNLNFRELQDEYIKGKKRNTQLRIKLNWYVNKIGLINEYKFKIAKEKYYSNNQYSYGDFIWNIKTDLSNELVKNDNNFLNRLYYYAKNIFNKKINKTDLEKFRYDTNIDKDLNYSSKNSVTRNKALVELIRLYTPDECSGCKGIYDLSTRTFIHRKTQKPYLEIHHNISFNNNIELDNEDNLVKLCPVCHSLLKKYVGLELEQKKTIENILRNNPNVKEFARHFFDTIVWEELIDKIYEHLK